MADQWYSLKMTMNKNGQRQLVHYETDTKNIVDYVQATTALINQHVQNATFHNPTFTGVVTNNATNTTVQNKVEFNGTVTHNANVKFDGGSAQFPNNRLIRFFNYEKNPSEVLGTIYSLSERENPEYKPQLRLSGGERMDGENGDNGDGAGLALFKLSDDPTTSGIFILKARTGKLNKDSCSLIGKGDGTLEWNNHIVITHNMLLDLIYPVGSVYISVNSTNPGTLFGGTWVQISKGRVLVGVGSGTDVNNKSKAFVAGDNPGEYEHKLTVSEIPSHGHGSGTTSAAGAHSHTRGNMNITGTFGADDRIFNDNAVTGAFYKHPNRADTASQHNEYGYIVAFDASRTWVGRTSTEGSHSHTLSLHDTGGGAYHNLVNPTFGVYIWKRTA